MTSLPRRSASLLIEEMQCLGPVRLSDVESAQQQIVDLIRYLDDSPLYREVAVESGT